jgi:hypothetical protein
MPQVRRLMTERAADGRRSGAVVYGSHARSKARPLLHFTTARSRSHPAGGAAGQGLNRHSGLSAAGCQEWLTGWA